MNQRKIKFASKGESIQKLTIENYERKTQLKYLESLSFEDDKAYSYIIEKSKETMDKKQYSRRSMWLGALYSEKLKSGYVNDVAIQWINEEIGYGVFACTNIKKGDYIGEYTGIIKIYSYIHDNRNPYCFRYPLYHGHPYMIDAQYQGNETSYLNHSDQPNCEPIVVWDGTLFHICFCTLTHISKGKELTFDYGDYWAELLS